MIEPGSPIPQAVSARPAVRSAVVMARALVREHIILLRYDLFCLCLNADADMLISGADAHFDGLGIGTGIVGQLDGERVPLRNHSAAILQQMAHFAVIFGRHQPFTVCT